MRITIPLGREVPFISEALRDQPQFMFRLIADQDRAVLGIGLHRSLERPLFDAKGRAQDWCFGKLCYEWKSPHQVGSGAVSDAQNDALAEWYTPRWVIEWNAGNAVLHAFPDDGGTTQDLLPLLRVPVIQRTATLDSTWTEHTDRATYLTHAEALLRHIQRGDIYEVNYCIERSTHLPDLDPFSAFVQLMERTKAPFAGFYREADQFALCASPERFLAFDHDRVVGEPMKGTRPRSADPVEDERVRSELQHDRKERSENIMALDVMRNDLSRIASSGSVVVEELCAVRTYPNVHQMVSTVSARIREGSDAYMVLEAAFPMASMTGAPKESAMHLIREHEVAPRGLYSGSLGFFAPDGTGDLNVVIRTVLYNTITEIASLRTGSALTAQCDPEREWDECTVKARSVTHALDHA